MQSRQCPYCGEPDDNKCGCFEEDLPLFTGVRDTSRKAYQEINDDGTVGTQARRIYKIVKENGEPMSLREIEARSGYDINAVSGRVNDIKKLGWLIECEKRKCTITGRTIIPVGANRLEVREYDI